MTVVIFILLIKLFPITCFPDESGDANQRIVRGKRIDIMEVPWQVSVLSFNKNFELLNLQSFCGGAIIGPREVLTAAHCVYMKNVSTLLIRAGSNSLLKEGSTYLVEAAQTYPEFQCTASKLKHDLAFIRIRESFQYSTHVKPIKISTRNPKNGEKVKISGWGKTKPGYVDPPGTDISFNNLQYAMLRVWDKAACYKDFKMEEILQFRDDLYCINNYKFGTKEAVCQGDSGSPVVLNDRLVGVVSAAIQKIVVGVQEDPNTPCQMIDQKPILQQFVCNDPKTVAVYNSVVDHRNWISEMLQDSVKKTEKE